MDITARELSYNKEQNIYTAEGDVELKEGTKRLNADFVLYNDTTKDAFAEGHVVFQESRTTCPRGEDVLQPGDAAGAP